MAKEIKANGLTIKTKDGVEVLGSDFNVEIKEMDEATKSFWATASSENPDRDNDIIRVSGWNLKNYKLNPVGLWAHNYFEHPHFKTETIKIDKQNKTLIFKPVFDTHDRALITWNQYKNGFLTSFSVGFSPQEFEYRDPNERWSGGREFTKQELLEISAVPVPAHPDARVNLDGFIFEEDNLLKNGFSENFGFDELKNMWWVPIDDLGSYKSAKTHQVFPGVLAVTAQPLYSKRSTIFPVVGYYFEQSEGFDSINSVKGFLDSRKIKNTVKRYYVFDYDKDGNFDSSIHAEVKELELKGEDEADYKGMPECDPDSSDYDPDMCEENTYIDENGCRKPKPKKSEEEWELIDITPVKDFVESEYDEIIESKDYAEKPFPNEHACRLKSPDEYDKFARKNCAAKHSGKCIDFIYGIKDSKSELQTMRYKKSIWDVEDAKKHCSSHKGSFEAASDKTEEDLSIKEIKFNIQMYNSSEELVEYRTIVLTDEEVTKTFVQLFDKSFLSEVKSMLEGLNSQLVELKKSVEELRNSTKRIDDTFEIDNNLIEFNSEEFTTPSSQKKENSEEIEIDPEEIKQAVLDELQGSFVIDLLEQELK
jgi:HK97 family phage prohead protease